MSTQTSEEIRAEAKALAEALMAHTAYERMVFLQALLENIELMLHAPALHPAIPLREVHAP